MMFSAMLQNTYHHHHHHHRLDSHKWAWALEFHGMCDISFFWVGLSFMREPQQSWRIDIFAKSFP
jgi:hypothetical protein